MAYKGIRVLKVAIFSTEDIHGGAARASARLGYGLLKDNRVDLTYYVKNKKEDVPTTKFLESNDNMLIDVEQMVQHHYINTNRTDLSNTFFSFSYNGVKLKNLDSYDILNLHWIEKFISLDNLYELSRVNKPIVWTLHDMKPFTGGCHYSSNCNDFMKNCEECSQLVNDSQNLTSSVLNIKHKIFKDANITIVSPSVWLAEEAKKSLLFKNKRVEVIPNGVDSAVFKPMNKVLAKKELGIGENTIVLTFGVMNHAEKRKGFSELIDVIKLLKEKIKNLNVIALFFGTSCDVDFPIPVVNIGAVCDDKKLSIIYSAADIFILPSLEDNLPNTILESLSCETPVVAFDTGGAKDIINDNNGKIVPKGDVQSLSDEIYNLIIHKDLREQKGKNGRKLIVSKYQLNHQADAYIKLFQELKNKKFDYVENKLDINSNFDGLVGYTIRERKIDNSRRLDFSKDYNILYNQIDKLKNNNYEYVIYGYGTIGKTTQSLIPEKIVDYVDIANEEKHPRNLVSMKFDKIIISVLGREDSIIKYLVEELGIKRDIIITFDV